MATKDITSPRVARIASRILRSRYAGRSCKTVAGSALVQSRSKKRITKRTTKRMSKRG